MDMFYIFNVILWYQRKNRAQLFKKKKKNTMATYTEMV